MAKKTIVVAGTSVTITDTRVSAKIGGKTVAIKPKRAWADGGTKTGNKWYPKETGPLQGYLMDGRTPSCRWPWSLFKRQFTSKALAILHDQDAKRAEALIERELSDIRCHGPHETHGVRHA